MDPVTHDSAPAEKRKARRYSLQLPVAITRAGRHRVNYTCCTSNISSGGVLLTCGQELQSGPIEYTVTLAHGDEQEIAIHCLGRIVRLEHSPDDNNFRVAATLERYEFLRSEP
jgi:hypothetical protein